MGVAMIKSEIENLSSFLATTDGSYEDKVLEEIIDELKVLVSLMREKRLEEGRKLNNLISNVLHMVDQRCFDESDEIEVHIDKILSYLRQTNRQLRLVGWRSEVDVVGEEDVVGLDEDVKLLVDRIHNQEKILVAWITGTVGCGKTTLAKLVYNHTDVVHKFELRIWVDCRNILSSEELFINIIRQVFGDDHLEIQTEGELMSIFEMLDKQVQDKRLFMVLDHIEEHPTWVEDTTIFLDKCGKGGGQNKLLVISRSAKFENDDDYIHAMRALDLDKSWQLLLKKMLRSDEKFPKQAERKGKLVLMKHTGGLPLAIKEAAMEWAEKRRQGIEWEAIVDSDVLELRASLEDLDLSFYYTLEPDEKAIFLHLGFFKLGENIRPQKFEHTFAASVPNSSVSDAHRPYVMSVDYLHHMKTIEFKDKDISVIPIYHKLSIGKAKKGNDGAHIGIIYCNRERFKGSTDQNEEELICVSFKGGSCLDHVSLSYWESFEQLRVLDFEGFGLRFLPESVSELMELRYLGLRNNHIKELPHWLSNLKKLEVLDISLNFMVKVPDIIWEMDALVHLYMSDIFCMKPLKVEALKNLETLTYISVDNWAYEVSGLQMMINLRKLKIEVDGNSDVSMLFASLADLKSLKCLVLQGFRFRSMPSLHGISVLQHLTQLKLVGCIPKLPNFHQNLRKLTLINSCLDEDPMPILEKLSRLWYLKMRNSYTGQQMVISKNGFPDLSEMFIEELWHLRNIRVEHVVLKLYRLEIRQCPYLHSLPKEMIVESTRF